MMHASRDNTFALLSILSAASAVEAASARKAGTAFVSPTLFNAVSTDVDAQSPVTQGEERSREAWQKIIDEKLIEWGWDASHFDDEGIEQPSRATVTIAVRLAQAFRDEGRPAPTSVVPDPNGGIVFERREGDVAEVLHVWDDGSVEYMRFSGAELVERQPPSF